MNPSWILTHDQLLGETQMLSSLVFCAFYPFSLSAAGTKALGLKQQQHLGLLTEWAKVNGPAIADKMDL